MALPYIKLYPGDFFRDTMHLTGFEKGIYLLLLMVQWQSGSLPSDSKSLAHICSLTPDEWRSVAKNVTPFFERHGDRLVQLRMAEDRELARAKLVRLTLAGKRSSEVRALKRKDKIPTNVPTNAEQMNEPSGVGDITESPVTLDSKKESPFSAMARFEEFWAAFPRREGRKTAYIAFFDAIHHGFSPDQIIAGARRYALTTAGEDQRFVMMPGRWIEGERFLDEAKEKPKAKNAFSRAADEIRREMGWTKREDQDDEGATIIDLTAIRN